MALLKQVSNFLNKARRNVSICRNLVTQSIKGHLVELSFNKNNGISIISMSKPPVNSLNLDMCVELKNVLKNAVEKNSKGIIITSTLPVFSAGLEMMEMHRPELKRFNEFWYALQDLWLTLYGLHVPTAVAINGASPAGGCLLALACEYRVMVQGSHTIGLNETKLGLVPPKWLQDSMIDTIGYRQTEFALLRGHLYEPKDALKIGLVDEIAVNKNDAVEKCEKYINEYAKISSEARGTTKLHLRKEKLAWLESNREWDKTMFLNNILLPQVQQNFDKYLHSL